MQLQPHPGTPRGPVTRFEVRAERRADGTLHLSYVLDASLARLQVPVATGPVRADGLWRHTCFEAFIAVPGSGSYCELNFSPSGAWAAYGFTGYRAGMTSLQLPVAPAAGWHRTADQLILEASVHPGWLLSGAEKAPLRLALSAVIEDQSGTMAYWALAHPPGQPDFHHPDGFALELAAVGARGTTGS